MLAGVGTVEVMDAVHGDDAMEEDNTIETNGSESGEANGLSINGDDSNDSFVNQLSIDTGDAVTTEPPAPNKPTIRIAKGLHKSPEVKSRSSSPAKLNIKRKSISSSSNGIASKKLRPSLAESEADIASLEKEVRALQWLARRKEQEWDQAVRLLKQKEEKLIRALRNKSLASLESEPAKLRLSLEATSSPALVQPQPVIVPQQQVMLLPQQPVSRIIAPKVAQVVRPAVATSPTVRSSKSPSPASRTTQPQRPLSNNSATSASGDLSEAKFATVLQKASKNLQKASSQGKKEEKKNTPQCQGCGNKKSEFVCAGCSNRWYCSRECQVEDWDEHADECAG